MFHGLDLGQIGICYQPLGSKKLTPVRQFGVYFSRPARDTSFFAVAAPHKVMGSISFHICHLVRGI